MTDKYTLEEIEAALRPLPVGSFSEDDYAREVLKRLTRPKHNFREGEVIHVSYMEDGQPTGEYLQWDYGDDFSTTRSLRLSEMPQAVEDLRNAVAKIPAAMADAALAKFDAEIEK